MNSKGGVVRRNVSFWQEDVLLIRRLAEKRGQSFSGALRQIVREWAEMKGVQEQKPHPVRDEAEVG